jgi:hypothetical protein
MEIKMRYKDGQYWNPNYISITIEAADSIALKIQDAVKKEIPSSYSEVNV